MKRTSVDEVLAATHESLLAVGVRRTTFAEVGRRAGLSRATLYTHFPDVEAAIAAVLTRELGALLSAAMAQPPPPDLLGRSCRDAGDIGQTAGGDPPTAALVGRSCRDAGDIGHAPGAGDRARGRLVGGVGRALEELPAHPLFRKVLEVDADLLLPYVVQRLGSVQGMALQLLQEAIIDGQRDGSIRDGDPAALATTVLLAVQSVLLASGVGQVAGRRGAVHAALLDLIDRGLRP